MSNPFNMLAEIDKIDDVFRKRVIDKIINYNKFKLINDGIGIKDVTTDDDWSHVALLTSKCVKFNGDEMKSINEVRLYSKEECFIDDEKMLRAKSSAKSILFRDGYPYPFFRTDEPYISTLNFIDLSTEHDTTGETTLFLKLDDTINEKFVTKYLYNEILIKICVPFLIQKFEIYLKNKLDKTITIRESLGALYDKFDRTKFVSVNEEIMCFLEEWGWVEGERHKAWVIDNIAQIVLGTKEYRKWLKEYNRTANRECFDEWDEGIAP